ncbi:MAG: hypothetical protein A2096_15020 [Spirochaetes bacterium GWF1_41_5]|nr:MAG: hypothetical protein A2096_15020 [Spirochaetes bacterium GWF1_41_5]
MSANVLLIEFDQWPWFCLSKIGNPNVNTPNLDALIGDGVLFTNAAAQNPICLPSRISMLAGQYVSTTRQFGFSGFCEHGIDWIHSSFKKAGYATGAFGKFHALSVGHEDWNYNVSAPTLPEENDLASPKGNTYKAYCEKHGIRWPTDQMHGHDPYTDCELSNSRISSHADKSRSLLEQGAAQSDVAKEHSLETWTTNQCIDFIRQNNKSPFFAWLTYDRPHHPTTLPKEIFDTIDAQAVVLQKIPDVNTLTGSARRVFNVFKSNQSVFRLGAKRFRFVLASYYRLIGWLDAEIGRIVTELKNTGLYNNTIIVCTMDHGDEAGFNGLIGKSRRVLSEAITRIPIIIKPCPYMISDSMRGSVREEPIENIDIYPTVCSLSGIPIPSGVEGKNLAEAIGGKTALDFSRPVFCEEYWKRMVKKDGWRLVFDIESDSECLLHDMHMDPEQFANLYNNNKYQQKRIELKKELMSFLSQRVFGRYTLKDVELTRRSLAVPKDTLPLHATTQDTELQLRFFRAGVSIAKNSEYEIFVPFYNDPILLFDFKAPKHRTMYRTIDQAIKPDPDIIERYLDSALRITMKRIAAVSIHNCREPVHELPASEEEARLLINEMQQIAL